MSLSASRTRRNRTTEHPSSTHRGVSKRTPFFSAENSFFQSRHVGIQPKLTVNAPGDKYEREADRVADAVMQMPDPQVQMQPVEEEEEMLQMQPAEVEQQLQMQAMEAMEEEQLQLQPIEEEEEELKIMPAIQMEAGVGGYASPQITRQINASKGQGNSLTPGLQQEMSQKMGADFSSVKVHTDSKAIQMNRQLGAKAFTHGSDIYFNKGKYNPASDSGKHLLAHELTHVVQQSDESYRKGGSANIQRQVGEVAAIVGIVVSVGTWAVGQGGGHSLTIDPELNRVAEPNDDRERYRRAHPFRKYSHTLFDVTQINPWPRPDEYWSVDLRWQSNDAELTDVHLEQGYSGMDPFTDTHGKLIMIDNQVSNRALGFRCEFEWDRAGIGHYLYQCDGWINADGNMLRTNWRRQDI